MKAGEDLWKYVDRDSIRKTLPSARICVDGGLVDGQQFHRMDKELPP